jgi:flagellar biosynthesis/type III secretory pathway protein FliH
LLLNLVETYLELNAREQAEYNRRLQVEGRTAVETLELTWGDRKVLEGRAQGLAEGLAEGAREAKREAVRDVVRTRFGSVPADLEARIAQAAEPELTQLLRRASLAAQLEELND